MVFILLSSPVSRQVYAVIRSLEPLALSSPWVVVLVRNLTRRCYFPPDSLSAFDDLVLPSPEDTSDAFLPMPVPNTPLAKPLTEDEIISVFHCLPQGMRLAESAATAALYKQNSMPVPALQETLGQIAARRLCGCCFEAPEEDDGPPESLQCSLVAGYPTLSQKRGLADRAEIVKEANVEV